MKDNLGDRCKNYEAIFERYFIPKIPIIIRIDGKCFSQFTNGKDKIDRFDLTNYHDIHDFIFTDGISHIFN